MRWVLRCEHTYFSDIEGISDSFDFVNINLRSARLRCGRKYAPVVQGAYSSLDLTNENSDADNVAESALSKKQVFRKPLAKNRTVLTWWRRDDIYTLPANNLRMVPNCLPY